MSSLVNKLEKPTLWSEGEGRWTRAETTEVGRFISRGSRVGMFLKIYCPVLETRLRGWGDHRPLRIRKRKRSGPLGDVVGSVNRSLRGWANYFHYRNSSLAMSKVRNHAEDRLRTHLMKRHKVKDRGTGLRRFPSADLYGRYGLYKVPAVAGWRSAHASA